jgi:lipooligosaccharide transport system permease protein
VTQLPLPLEWLAYVTPLWHGVDLCRELTLGNVHFWRALGHVAYLSLFVVLGLIWGRRTYAARLLK